MKRTVFIMMILLMLSKITGFLRTTTISSTFGAGYLTDVYNAAFMIPGLFTSIVLSGLNTSMIPVLSSAEKDGCKERTFNRFLSLGIVFSLAVVLLIFLFAGAFASVTVRGFAAGKLADVAHYTRMMSVITGMQIVTYIFTGYLNQSNRFYIVAAVAIPMNLIIITMTRLAPSDTILWLVIANLIGYLSQLIWVSYPFLREKYPFRFEIDLKDPYLPIFFSMVAPILLTTSVSQLNVIIDQILASYLPEGHLSILYNASKVNSLFQSVLIMSFTTIMFTQQSRLAHEDRRGLLLVTQKNLSMILLLIVPVTLGVLFLHQQIFRIIFLRGEYTLEASAIGGTVLFYYTFSLFGWSVNDVLGKFFYSTKDAKKTIWPSLIIIGSNIALNLLLVRFMGVYGLALASSVSIFIGMLIFYRKAKVRFDEEQVPIFSQSIPKYFLAGGAMVGLLALLRQYSMIGSLPDLPNVLANMALGAGMYFLVLFGLKTQELTEMKELLLSKLRRR